MLIKTKYDFQMYTNFKIIEKKVSNKMREKYTLKTEKK